MNDDGITTDGNHHFRSNPAMVISITMALPHISLPYSGFPAVTAVLPLFPLLCSSLVPNAGLM